MDFSSIATGFLALLFALISAVFLVFILFRVDLWLTRRLNEEELLRDGNRSIGIVLGAVLVCQAILLRHAVFPVMAEVRNAFVAGGDLFAFAYVLAYALVTLLVIGSLAILLVALALWLFVHIPHGIDEASEILKDNMAVAIFLSAVMLAITLIVNEGMDDFARSIITYAESGTIQIK